MKLQRFCVPLLKFPIHIVVAIPLPLIFLKLSTCIPQAKDVSELAIRFMSSGIKATPTSIIPSNKTATCLQCKRSLSLARTSSAMAIPIFGR